MKAKTKLFLYKAADKALVAAPWVALTISLFTTKGAGSVGARVARAFGGKALRKGMFSMLSADAIAKKMRSDLIQPKIEGLMKTQLLEQAEKKTRELRAKP